MGLEVLSAASSPVVPAHPHLPRGWDRAGGSPTSAWTVKLLSKDDWRLLDQARVRSLATSAAELAGDLEAALGFDESQWQEEIRKREWSVVADGVRPIGVMALNKSSITDPLECSVIDQPHAHIEALWVDPRFRRRGIARALIAAVVEETTYSPAIGLWVFENNLRGARTFEALGFRRSSPSSQQYFGESAREQRSPRHEYHMHLALNGPHTTRQSAHQRGSLGLAP